MQNFLILLNLQHRDVVALLLGMMEFASKVLLFYAIASYCFRRYREDSYLFQLSDREESLRGWISLLAPMTRRLPLPRIYQDKVSRDLRIIGAPQSRTVEVIVAHQVVYGSAGFLITGFSCGVGKILPPYFILLGGLYGLALPVIRLHFAAKKKVAACHKSLPYFIDYLCLAMGAGMDFNQALRIVVTDAPVSPLTHEFKRVLAQMQLGTSRSRALLAVGERLDTPLVKLFIHTLIQAAQLGSDMVATLEAMSETIQTRRFLEAEEKAGKIAAKIIIPIIFFVMPAVMLLLMGPMLINVMKK
jgi:tight adherence protein C